MSTFEKGTAFEKRVHEHLIQLLQTGELGISGNLYKVYHQKEFYSEFRKANIKFDLVIEFYRKEGVTPNFYILVECKDYGSRVPASDLEEFFSKARQVLHANFKCMVFTTNSLQETAFNYAVSTGMAVVRILDDDSLSWIVERTNKHLTTSVQNSVAINVSTALTNEYYVTTRNDTFGTYNFKSFLSVKDIFTEVLKDLNEESKIDVLDQNG